MINRFIGNWIEKALKGNKICVVSGPRQVGKSHLISHLYPKAKTYILDSIKVKIQLKKDFGFFDGAQTRALYFFDEVHHLSQWRTFLKNLYDTEHRHNKYIASGSSAFELLKKGQGDSLAGRALWLRLLPVTFREFLIYKVPKFQKMLPQPWDLMDNLTIPSLVMEHEKEIKKYWEIYSDRGGFPEPLLMNNTELRNKWLSDYKDALLERDLKDITQSKDIERIYAVFELLCEQVSSRYSLRSIADTLHTTAVTIKSDIAALKRLLLIFEIESFGTRLSKSIRKEKKIYPIDSSILKLTDAVYDNAGPYFETEVATSLYKHMNYFSLGKTQKAHLTYYRDYEHREVDFLLSYNKNTFLIESKLKIKNFSTSINYLHENNISRFKGIIVTKDGPYERIAEKQITIPIHLLAASLY